MEEYRTGPVPFVRLAVRPADILADPRWWLTGNGVPDVTVLLGQETAVLEAHYLVVRAGSFRASKRQYGVLRCVWPCCILIDWLWRK